MTALIYEILALASFLLATFSHVFRENDTDAALCLLMAIYMAVMSIKYDKGEE